MQTTQAHASLREQFTRCKSGSAPRFSSAVNPQWCEAVCDLSLCGAREHTPAHTGKIKHSTIQGYGTFAGSDFRGENGIGASARRTRLDYSPDPIVFHSALSHGHLVMRVAQHKIRVARHRPPLTFYDLRIDRIARLLRRAIQSGEKGLLESEVGNVRSCASTMIRAYDTALESSLHLSLTKHHCASIDEKSHRIELLRPRLEKKIAGMNRQEQPPPGEYRPRAATDLLQPVEIFLGHCAEFRDAALRMCEMNAELMRRSDSNRSARLRASYPS